MKKVMNGLFACCMVALLTANAQDGLSRDAHSSRRAAHTAIPSQHAVSRDTAGQPVPDTSFRYQGDSSAAANDTVISVAGDAPAQKKDAGASPKTGAKPAGNPVGTATTGAANMDARPAEDAGGTATAGAANMDAKPAADAAGAGSGSAPKTDTTPSNPNQVTKTDAGNTIVVTVKTPATTAEAPKADQQQSNDTATKEDRSEETRHELDRRWFISPLLKLQFQDFAMLEKNRKGYLSNANNLPFFQRGNASFAASAYKNLTQRLSVSADLGLSFGHVTSNDILISQTQSKTFNLLNAAVYYHLIGPSYRLQPYVTVGFNDLINDASYLTLPMGVGAKFNSRKIMVTGQVTYGYGLSKNNASTTMYSVGIYLPINSKKHKQPDDDDKSLNKKDEAGKKDSTSKGNGNVTNNIYITINMDSVLKAKGLLDENGKPVLAGKGSEGDGSDEGVTGSARRKKPFRSLGLNDFNEDDYRIDSLDGKPVIRFVIYFEFNEYGLNSKAFGDIDKVISHLKRSQDYTVEIKGYTDSVGSEQYNNILSRKRAKMVLDYMNSRGVPSELMKAKAYGSDSPVGDNSDPNQAWLNRRAEIIVHPKDQLASQ
ncbi:MAG TPA: OmpA family protein [Puia sp.]|nr:OmpA family protein [Puia sp.]